MQIANTIDMRGQPVIQDIEERIERYKAGSSLALRMSGLILLLFFGYLFNDELIPLIITACAVPTCLAIGLWMTYAERRLRSLLTASGKRRSHNVTLLSASVTASIVTIIVYLSVGFLLLAMAIFERQALEALASTAVIEQHIGNLESGSLDIGASMQNPGDNFVFDVTGPKGQARVEAKFRTRDQNTEELISGSIELSTGETFDLFPGCRRSDDGETIYMI